jgi:hypothetical protein
MREGGRRKPVIGKKHLFARPLLGGVQRRSRRPDGGERFNRVDGIDRYVLELERHHVNAAGKRSQRVDIVIFRGDLDVGDLPCGCVLFGREGMDAVAHPTGSDAEHAPKLPAAKHSEGSAWSDHFHGSCS